MIAAPVRGRKAVVAAPAPPPDPIGTLILAYRQAKALFTASELDLFRSIEDTDGTAEAVARRSRATPRAVEMLLDALVASGFIEKEGGVYRNTPFAKERLDPRGARSVANNLRYQELLSEAYAGLARTARTGRPRLGLKELLTKRPDFTRDYIRGMDNIARRPAEELARALDLSRAETLLDVGGGPGTFSFACLARAPGLRATILDLPSTLKVTREFVAAAGLAGRVSLAAGDYHRRPFGSGRFDVALLSHVTHDEGPEQNLRLLRKARAALRDGGQVVIHDFMTDESRAAPAFAALFSLHLLAYTRSGRCYSEGDYRVWLRRAGFDEARRVEICAGAPNATRALIAAKRKGG